MKSFLPSKVYDVLKWAVILALPAISEFIAWLFPAYGIPNGDLVAETIRRVALLIGVLIGVSSIQYGVNALKSKNNIDISDFIEQTHMNTDTIDNLVSEGEVENVIQDTDINADNVE